MLLIFQSLIPRPSYALNLNFNNGSLPSGATASGGANGTRINSSGVLVTDSAPRFDYGPTSHASLGVLVEPAQTNLLPYSNDFTNTFWNKVSGLTIGTGVTAPDGATIANNIIPGTGSGFQYVIEAQGHSLNGSVSQSVWVKAAGYSKIALRESAQSGAYVAFNLASGTILGASTFTDYVVSNPSISPAGNGWYRISFAVTFNGGYSFGLWVLPEAYTSGAPTDYSWAGDGSSGICAWGAQQELGTSVTTYIPTTTATVARTADEISIAIPAGVSSINVLFDDNTTQTLSVTPSSTYVLPTNLNRARVQSVTSLVADTGIHLSGSAAASASGSAVLEVQHHLSGAAVALAAATAGLRVTHHLAAAAASLAASTASLRLQHHLGAIAAAAAAGSANLEVQRHMAAAGAAQATATAAMRVQYHLAAAAADVATATGALRVGSAPQHLAAAAAAQATVTAALDVQHHLAAAAQATVTATANLDVQHHMTGAALAQATTTANIRAQHHLAAAAQAQSLVTGALDVQHHLTAAAQAIATGSGALRVQHHLAASAAAQSLSSAALELQHHLTATANSIAAATGSLNVATVGQKHLTAAAASRVATTAALDVQHHLQAAANALANAYAMIDVQHHLMAAAQSIVAATAALEVITPATHLGADAAVLSAATAALRAHYHLSANGEVIARATADLQHPLSKESAANHLVTDEAVVRFGYGHGPQAKVRGVPRVLH